MPLPAPVTIAILLIFCLPIRPWRRSP
jgi:hypothetical protein